MTLSTIAKKCEEKISKSFNYIMHPSILIHHKKNISAVFNDNIEISKLCDQITYFMVNMHHAINIISNKNKELDTKNTRLASINKDLRKEIENRLKDKQNLEEMSQNIVTTSRQAGMSDLATTILHDVGNVLNSLNTSIDFLHEHLATSKMDKLSKAAMKMERAYADGDKFIENEELKLLVPYINEVSKHLNKEYSIINDELASIKKNVNHIKNVIQTQQQHAKKSASTEKIQINRVVDEALEFSRTSISSHNITIETNYSNLPVCTIDKHMVLQIITNLISNSVQSLIEKNNNDKKIIMQTKCVNTDKFEISVQDNGVGIVEDNLIKIFSHGFTTKKTGHGFGLHGCANGAKSLGGTLRVHSDGADQGALFTLELPFRPKGNLT